MKILENNTRPQQFLTFRSILCQGRKAMPLRQYALETRVESEDQGVVPLQKGVSQV
jgi:hypothetical protein